MNLQEPWSRARVLFSHRTLLKKSEKQIPRSARIRRLSTNLGTSILELGSSSSNTEIVSAEEEQELVRAIFRRVSTLIVLLVVAGASQLCWAHAILMESTPKLNSTVKGPDLAITLRFNVRIDGGRSRVRLSSPDGTVSTLALASQSSPDSLQTHAAGMKPGAYKLQWQVLASDGHMSRGEIPFTVS